MTKEQTAQVLRFIKVNFSGFAKQASNIEDANAMLNTWSVIFRDDPYEVVELAALKLIESETSGFPNAAMLRKKIDELKAIANGEPSNEELWLLLRKAAENGNYGAEEEYRKLPDILKDYLGSPSALRDMANSEIKTLDSVTKGIFMKSIGNFRDRKTYAASIPESVKQAVAQLYKPMPDADALDAPAKNNLPEVYA